MSEKKYPFWQILSHTFLLGSGASRAAFPNGDKNGRKLPLMNDFVEIVGLKEFLNKNGIDFLNKNIEEIYNSIYCENPNSPLLDELNEKIINYFSLLKIPDEVTLYDELILSLQKKDAIFSFNWDPLLLQAFSRNYMMKELPQIHFLHGNILVGVCEKDKHHGYLGNSCPICNKKFTPSRILFPIKKKNYNEDPFIQSEWEAMNFYLDNSFIFSIFGYSAPTTDIEARRLMLYAWTRNKQRILNEIEIIDIKPKNEVKENWSTFIYKDHGGIYKKPRNTILFRHPRRSCESWGDAIMQCDPWNEMNLPKFKRLENLQNWVKPLIKEEINFRENDIPLRKFSK